MNRFQKLERWMADKGLTQLALRDKINALPTRNSRRLRTKSEINRLVLGSVRRADPAMAADLETVTDGAISALDYLEFVGSCARDEAA